MTQEQVYLARSRFFYNINDMFLLGRNLDKMRALLEQDEWVTERKGETVYSYQKGEIYSETTYVEDRPPEFFRCLVKITGIEEYPFDTRVTLRSEDEKTTIIEYRVLAEFGPEIERDIMIMTMDEIRKQLFEQFAAGLTRIEKERGEARDVPIPFVDIEVRMDTSEKN